MASDGPSRLGSVSDWSVPGFVLDRCLLTVGAWRKSFEVVLMGVGRVSRR